MVGGHETKVMSGNQTCRRCSLLSLQTTPVFSLPFLFRQTGQLSSTLANKVIIAMMIMALGGPGCHSDLNSRR